MNSMIEAVARKIEPTAWAAFGIADSVRARHRRTASLRKAAAIIQAMIDHGPTLAKFNCSSSCNPGPMDYVWLTDAFIAMLRKILEEQNNG